MDLSSVVPNSTPPRFVNSQLVSLPSVGILNNFCFSICFIYTAPQACSFKHKPCINIVAKVFLIVKAKAVCCVRDIIVYTSICASVELWMHVESAREVNATRTFLSHPPNSCIKTRILVSQFLTRTSLHLICRLHICF